MISIELPWPPSINNYWRHTSKGHYISKKGQEYREFVLYACIQLKNKFHEKDRLIVTIDAFPPDKRKRDLDNILKSLLDALQHAGVYYDDSQIDKLSVRRFEALDGVVKITIGTLENEGTKIS
jgi:crossover junction endodeoxyribonuclease RusA